MAIKKNRVDYLKSSLISNSFHFLLLQGLYRGSVKDPVHQLRGCSQVRCNIKLFNWKSKRSIRHCLRHQTTQTSVPDCARNLQLVHTFLFSVEKEHMFILLLPLEIQQVELWLQSFNFLEHRIRSHFILGSCRVRKWICKTYTISHHYHQPAKKLLHSFKGKNQ